MIALPRIKMSVLAVRGKLPRSTNIGFPGNESQPYGGLRYLTLTLDEGVGTARPLEETSVSPRSRHSRV